MRRWLRVTWFELFVGVGLLAALFAPTTPWVNIYCPVAADVEFWSDAECLRTETWLGAPDHVVKDGQLHLRVQSTRHALVIVTVVDAPGWGEQAVAAYRAGHPTIERLWPEQPIRWLRQ